MVLICNNTAVSVENSMKSTKLLELKTEFKVSKITGYNKVNTQNPVIFLYIGNVQLEIEIFGNNSHLLPMEQLDVNLTKYV